jgi:hypothetical protein
MVNKSNTQSKTQSRESPPNFENIQAKFNYLHLFTSVRFLRNYCLQVEMYFIKKSSAYLNT